MATRFYLPSSGTSPLTGLAIAGGWDCSHASFFRAPTATTAADTALTNFSDYFPSSTTQEMCFAQWVSSYVLDANVDFTSSNNISGVVRAFEGISSVDAFLACVVRVVSGDGSTVRGTLISYNVSGDSGVEFYSVTPGSVAMSSVAMGSVSAFAGDRIVIEVGSHGDTPSTAYTHTLRFGDPSAVSDFTLGNGSGSDLRPWVSLSNTLALVAAGGAATYVPRSIGAGIGVGIGSGIG